MKNIMKTNLFKNTSIVLSIFLITLFALNYNIKIEANLEQVSANEKLIQEFEAKNPIKTSEAKISEGDRKVKLKLNPFEEMNILKIKATNGKEFKYSTEGYGVYTAKELIVDFKNKKLTNEGKTFNYEILQILSNGSQFEIDGYEKRPSWKKEINDNVFEGNLYFFENDLINELTIEEYMRGMAEVPEYSHHEKRKALSVSIRSYIEYYTNGKGEEKFPWKKYNASDDPKIFQKYLGYNYYLRSPKWKQALEETKNEMIYYKWEVLRVPYYSCTLSKNGRTLNPSEAGWGGYFQERIKVFASKPDLEGIDTSRDTREKCGHGVGMSGQGSEIRAQQGMGYKEILQYYFTGVEIK